MLYFLRLIQFSLQNLLIRKLTSCLAILGLLFGSAAFIATLSTTEGSKKNIQKQLRSMGTDLLWVSNYGKPRLEPYHLKFIEKYGQHKILAATLLHKVNAQVRAMGIEESYDFFGIDQRYIHVEKQHMSFGRSITTQEILQQKFVCILGADVAEELYGQQNPVGEHLLFFVDGAPFPLTIVGVLRQKGANAESDYAILVPQTIIKKIAKRDYSSEMIIKVKEDATTKNMKALVKTLFKPAFADRLNIYDAADIIESSKKIWENINFLGLTLALVALITGGIGIMNVMVLSVAQRRKEVGLRKALGAKKTSILSQFLLEAIMICLTGGLIGSIVGIGFGHVMASAMGITASVSWITVSISLIFSVGVGLIFGLLPAMQAAKLDPYEALRS